MNNCHVSNQIAIHCDESESYCPECGSTMTFGDTAKTQAILFCDNEECLHEVDTEEGF